MNSIGSDEDWGRTAPTDPSGLERGAGPSGPGGEGEEASPDDSGGKGTLNGSDLM